MKLNIDPSYLNPLEALTKLSADIGFILNGICVKLQPLTVKEKQAVHEVKGEIEGSLR